MNGYFAKKYPNGYGKFLRRQWRQYKYLYLMLIPVIVYYAVFHYRPMYGVLIAFKNFSPGKGILGSPWVGFKFFLEFFDSYYFTRIVRNTLLINIYGLLFTFPAPILLALLLNEVRSAPYKKLVQTISYLPHFVSTVVIAGLVLQFVAKNGFINNVAVLLGGERVSFMLNPRYFRTIYLVSDVWQGIGWGSIIYLAALSGISPELYEAATIDGAGRFKQMLHITLPGISSTIIILLILKIGNMMNLGFEKIILLYNESIYETADVISSFIYRRGILEANYSYSTAVGLFNSVINLILILGANMLSRKFTETYLW